MTHEIPADRPGLPDPESVRSVETFVSPQHEEYQILHTTEVDAYDPPPKPKKVRRPARAKAKEDPTPPPA